MEILIPGLILVALMVWASTKIKKTAADAFEPEFIETDDYSLQKPEGFLHVIGDEVHDLSAYSREYGKNDNTGIRQATIQIDVFPNGELASIVEPIRATATNSTITSQTDIACELNADEAANEIAVNAFYKIVAARGSVYRLRFAVLAEHKDEYLRRIDETLESFNLKTN